MPVSERPPPPSKLQGEPARAVGWGRFADRLACPECRSPLRFRETEFECEGREAHRFPLTSGGVPVLLEATERRRLYGDLEGAAVMQRDYNKSLLQKIARHAKRWIGSTLHLPISSEVMRVRTECRRAQELALEVGSGIQEAGADRVNLDTAAFRNVVVVGSALNIPFADDTFGFVRNAAVLEHVREPQRMIDEMGRVLKPGGHVYTEVPFLQHFHAYPNDFQRYTVEGLKQAFKDFEVVETGVCVGPSSAITALIADWCELLTFSSNRTLNDLVRTVPLLILWPLKYLDRLLVRNPRAHELASGIYLLARKAPR